MGKGGHNTSIVHDRHEQLDTATLPAEHRLPTLSEIKVKIPGHCFRPTVRESMSYVIKDVFYVAVTFAVMFQLQKSLAYGFLFFPLYWFIQGLIDFHSPIDPTLVSQERCTRHFSCLAMIVDTQVLVSTHW